MESPAAEKPLPRAANPALNSSLAATPGSACAARSGSLAATLPRAMSSSASKRRASGGGVSAAGEAAPAVTVTDSVSRGASRSSGTANSRGAVPRARRTAKGR